jgi:hypothetical protein
MIPINNLTANINGNLVTYSFPKPALFNSEVTYELGLSYLLDSKKDITLYSSYSEIEVFRSSTYSPINITLSEQKNFILSKVANVNGISLMARVRMVSLNSDAYWSNGVYTRADQINFIPTYTPAPVLTYTPRPSPTQPLQKF